MPNLIKKIFFPKKAKIAEIKNNFNEIKSKFLVSEDDILRSAKREIKQREMPMPVWETKLRKRTEQKMYNVYKKLEELRQEASNLKNYELANEIADFVAKLRKKHDTIRAIRESNLRKTATIDFLTQTYAFEVLKELSYRAIKRKGIHSFAFIDIDNFKAINDKLGYHFGSLVLKKFGEALNDSITNYVKDKNLVADKNYFIGRVGGDEFLIYLNLPTQNMIELLKEVDKNFVNKINSDFQLPLELRKNVPTISVGIHSLKQAENKKEYAEMREKLDELLRIAKGKAEKAENAAGFAEAIRAGNKGKIAYVDQKGEKIEFKLRK